MKVTPKMKELAGLLHSGKHSLVVENGHVATFDGHGISDLYRLLTENPAFLKGAHVADKIVGKGAAALMAAGGVRSLYTDTISIPALELLRHTAVIISYGQSVPNIINRRGDGVCPVETLCMPCRTAGECLPMITGFINLQNFNQNAKPDNR